MFNKIEINLDSKTIFNSSYIFLYIILEIIKNYFKKLKVTIKNYLLLIKI